MLISFGARLLAAFFCVWAWSAHAAQEGKLDSLLELSLEELVSPGVVSPTTKVELGNAPGGVTTITYEQIRNSPAQTIPELLRGLPGLNIRWNPMVQTVDVRSFGSNPFTSRALLLIDGVPYNSWNKGGFPQHPGFDFFNLDYVHHIEVQRGPGSALYGQNAFNAVINIVTLNGEDEHVDRVKVLTGDQETTMASASRGWRVGSDGSLFLGARQFQGVMPTELWEEYGTGRTEGYDLFAKLLWRGWEATYYRIDDALDGFVEPFDGGLTGSVFQSADNIEQTINIASLKYMHQSEDERWSTSVHATRAERDGSHCGSCHARGQDSEFATAADHGYQNFVEANVTFVASDRHRLLAGAEYREISSGEHPTPAPADGVLDYDKTAVYLQDHFQVTEDLQLIAGVRYDGATSPDLFDADVFPRLDVIYDVHDRLTIRGQWGRAGRYPSISEMYQSGWFISAEFPSGPPLVLAEFVPNPDLEPEHIETYAIGAETVLSKKSRLRLDIFRNVIDDYIGIAYPRFRFENHPQQAIVYGAEVDLDWEVSEQLTLAGNYSYQAHRRRGNGVDSAGSKLAFTYAPRHKINLKIDYTLTQSLSAHLDVHWKGAYRAPDFWYGIALGEAPHDLDDYTLVNLRINYQLPFVVGGRKPLRLSVIGTNLGNERAPETLIGSSAALTGREGHVQLEYSFAD